MNREQLQNGLYAHYSLSDVVDRFMVRSFNNGRKYYNNFLLIAQDVWKELYWKTLRIPKTKVLPIDLTTMTVRIPGDCMKIFALRTPGNCGPEYLKYNGQLDLVPASKKTCGCKDCNCDSEACASMHGIQVMQEDVELGGQIYQRVIKTRVEGNHIVHEIKEPYAVQNGPSTTITYDTHTESVATLDTKPCGCVIDSPENRRKCYDYSCCPVECCDTKCPDLRDRPGEYKIDRERGLIYLYDSYAKKVTLTYASNGEEHAEEIMIPEYCMPAMYAGMYLGSIQFRTGQRGYYEVQAAERKFNYEKQELYEFLNPLIPHEFMQLQYKKTLW